ncbi:MAG: peptide ABC transporter permease [Candidatus Marinimicrobia bacterium]|nr:peptide ABC transporter permease [Candidatus Neomarinimicrobiota bacterium]|tara:strand:+ start:2299 stop:3213 length:915 start_codon:yes stop_codon:yes gene_type:complete
MNNNWIKKLIKNKKAKIGIIIISIFIFIAIIGPFLFPNPNEYVDNPLLEPSLKHIFGTTKQGQDVLAQTIAGARPTLFIGILSGILVVFVGLSIGSIAAYYGGKTDNFLSLLINIFLLMPGLPLMVIIAAVLPPGPYSILSVLVFTGWAWNARVLRSQVLTLRQRDYVHASIINGEADFKIIINDIWPQMMSLITSSFIGATIYTIGAQVGLEFLGLGDVNKVTWGNNLYWATNDLALLTGSWWTYVPTGLCIAFVSFGLTLINYGIDEISNPRLLSERLVKERYPYKFNRNGSTPVIRTEHNE